MQLKYREFGSGPTKLLILHGLLGSSQNWNAVAQKLASFHNVIVPDLRNHGHSPHGTHTIEAVRDDVLELIDELQLDKILLMGHSMGGLAAMAFACAYPDRLLGLIVVDIGPIAGLSSMEWILKALQGIELSQVRSRADADRALSKSVENPIVRQFLLQNLRRHEDGSYQWRCNLPELHRFVSDRTRFRLASTDAYVGPTLFVAGGRSEHKISEQKEVIHQHFPNAELVTIPQAGHWVHFEAITEFVDVVASFTDAHSPKRGFRG